jgi:EAL domain-containing protein (putative c-di-GMP-specific phosphodiesterase class I)
LTESILIRDTASILATVKRLKLLGVKLSIDDFGTGYSSLSYLKRFSVDKLKIDQSFIRDLGSDPDDAAIVRAIIQMARSLGLKTIAEGVEDEQVLHHLQLFHCDEAQGYHIARPMPAEEFARFLSTIPTNRALNVAQAILL